MQRMYWDTRVGKDANWGDDHSHASRQWLKELIMLHESVLEIGFGTGKDYENILHRWAIPIKYRGYEVCPSFIDLCRERFPDGDFLYGDALSLPEQYNSWDTVICRHMIEHTSDWERALREAFRIARRRVILIGWRGPSLASGRMDYGDGGYCWNIHGDDLQRTLDYMSHDIEYRHFDPPKENWGWVINKNDVIFDLDDFRDDAPIADRLLNLKAQFPQLKVTLFTIPGKSTIDVMDVFVGYDWIELAVHGLNHDTNTECKDWTAGDTHEALDIAERMGVFVKGFKAPGWEINPEVCKVLADRGYWLAHHIDKPGQIGGVDIPIYWSHHPWMLHGHVDNIHTGPTLCHNGLDQLCENGPPFHDHMRFHTISEFLSYDNRGFAQ